MRLKLHPLALLFGTLALTTSFPAFAQSNSHRWEAIVFGGVDEAKAPANMFQESFIHLSSALSQNGWTVQPLFGNEGDCSGCGSTWDIDPIAAAANLSPSQVPKASKRELLKKLDSAITHLRSGDQLLVTIDTHGMADYEGAVDTTRISVFDENDPHSIKENQLDSKGNQIGTMRVDDPELVARYQTLKNNGVKLAFGSDSCFSGPTAKVLGKYGCVVTQTSGKKYGLGTPVSDSIVDLITASSSQIAPVALEQNGSLNMEDLFLDLTTYATNGLDSPYYQTPYAGVLEPEFSAFLSEYESVENLAGPGLLNIPTNEFTIIHNQLQLSGSLNNYSELKNFISQFLAPFANASTDSKYQTLAEYYLKRDANDLGLVTVDTPSELVNRVTHIQANFTAAQTQYQNLTQQEDQIQSAIAQSGVAIQYALDTSYADAQENFNTTVQSLSGKSIFVAGGWMSIPLSVGPNGTPQRFFAPTDTWFKTETVTLANQIAEAMSKTYPSATGSDFKLSLANTIFAAETAAWNRASANARIALSQSQKIADIEAQKDVIFRSGSGLRFVQDAIEARMYAYLFHRAEVGGSDSDVNLCRDFTLRSIE
jgi:hypothetical protein